MLFRLWLSVSIAFVLTVLTALASPTELRRRVPQEPSRSSRIEESLKTGSSISSFEQITKRGYLQVKNTANDTVVGYFSRRRSVNGYYRYEVAQQHAMIVNFTTTRDATSASGIRLNAENSDILPYPVIGLVQGRDSNSVDISTGSFNYLYIAGSAASPRDATPAEIPNSYTDTTATVRSAQSDVWSIDLVTNALTAHWVNQDGSKPETHFFCQGISLYAGGNYDMFKARYESPSFPFALTFLPL